MPKLRIREIRVRNFGSFIKESLELGGLKYPVLVLGDNGAGKTVFFVDSITYAFFGVAYERGNVSKKMVSRMHGGGDVEATIVLESSDGVLFEVRNKKVYRVRPRTEYPQINVLTGHNYNSLLATYIVRQGRVAKFFEIRAADRREYLLDLLEYRFDKVRERVKEELDRIKDEIGSVRNRLSEIEGMFKSLGLEEVSEEALDRALEAEHSKKKELEDRAGSLRDRLKFLRERLEELKVRRKELEDILKTIEEYRRALNKLDDVRREISRYHSEPDRLEDSLLDELKSYVEEAVETLERMDSLSSYTRDIERLLRDYSDLSGKGDVGDIPRLRERLKSLRELRGQIKSEMRMYRERIDKLSKAGSTCPICGSPLDEEHRNKVLSEAREAIKKLESRMKDVEEKIRAVEGEIKGLEKLERMVREVIGKIVKVFEEISGELGVELPSVDEDNIVNVSNSFMTRVKGESIRLGKEFTRILGRIEGLGFRIDMLTSKIEGEAISKVKRMFGDYVREVERLYREFGKRIEVFQSFEEKVKGLDEEEVKREIREVDAEIKALDGEYHSVEEEYEKVSRALGEVDARIKALEGLRRHLKSYVDYRERLEVLEADRELHTDLYNIFKEGGFPTYLINEVVIPRLNEYTNYYLEEFNTNFRVRFEVKGTTIDAKVFEGDRERYLNSLSGGEMTLIGLAFRLAFGRLIALLGMNYVFDFIILDEALTHLDDRNKRIVAEKLAKMVDEGVISQVIIITHDRTIQELPFMGGTVIRVDKPAAVSRVVLADKEDIEV